MKLSSLSALLGLGILLLAAAGCRTAGALDGTNDRISWRNGVMVRQAMLDDNAYNRQYKVGPPMSQVRYITIHNTWNVGPARNERNYLNNRRDNVSISFHYAVDETEALQILPHYYCGWHAGDGAKGPGNSSSIGIEICRSRCYDDKEPLYRQAEENGARLAASLLTEFNLPMSALRKHEDWSGKKCPHRILEENRWEAFKARVREIREGGI